MSSEIAIKVENLSKCYQIYDQPHDRLKQFILPRLQGIAGQLPKKYFREFWALQDVSFEVKKGETVGIIGRNGSGKSTLLQMICGTLNQTSGSIQTQGRIAALLELGSGFNPEFTGRENVFLNASILGLSNEETEAYFESITSFAGIGSFIDQPVKTYSSGMIVRLAFAVSSSVEPEILIVDEALAVGDAIFQAKCFRRFQELKARGVTVLLVSHDLSTITQLCSKAFVLNSGQLISEGSVKEMADFYRRLCSEEAEEFLDNSMDNFQTKVYNHEVLSEWMDRSPNTQEYGDGKAIFLGFTLLNSEGYKSNKINSGESLTLRLKIEFKQMCIAPIAAFGFRDLAGHELCGTNTWYENSEIGTVNSGSIIVVDFFFSLPLQRGIYNLCIACTEIGSEGLIAHHRLYDVVTIEVDSSRRFTGRFDLKPNVEIFNT
jgi:ABC-type polysaccharide/polyol phosphate transport system ATPase subunit